MHWFIRFAILLACFMQIGCGVVVGTVLDTVRGAITYPVKEYAFCGAYKYDNTWETPYKKIEKKENYGDVLLGFAISGGGSRSAYFSACVLEQLGKIPVHKGSKKSYLDELDYISSVSGGSLASAYYCLEKIKYKKEEDFFRAFREAMRYNYEIRAAVRIIFRGYAFLNTLTYHDRGDTMADVWDSLFFEDATFADLLAAEQKGAPTLIVNGTNLSDGLKFVFSTLDDKFFNRGHYFQNIRKAGFIKHATSGGHVAFRTVGFASINSDVMPYPVSKAVVASASVPNLLGPVTLKDYTREDIFLNVSDGGIYDNYGIESLMQVFTEYLERNPGKKAKIVIVDGSGYFQVEKGYHDHEQSVAYYSDRPLSISWLRTKHYMEYIFEKARKDPGPNGDFPYRNLDFELVSLYDVLPSQESQKRTATQKILRPDITTLEFLKDVTSIQTRFTVSDKDAARIEKVSQQVAKKLQMGQKK